MMPMTVRWLCVVLIVLIGGNGFHATRSIEVDDGGDTGGAGEPQPLLTVPLLLRNEDGTDLEVQFRCYWEVEGECIREVRAFCVEHSLLHDHCEMLSHMVVSSMAGEDPMDSVKARDRDPGPRPETFVTIEECLRASKSQWGQDFFVYANFFNTSELRVGGGFYVDVGANTPYALSNTWFLDKCLGWKGVCIEANRELAEVLRGTRSCIVVEDCVAAEVADLHFNTPGREHELGYISEGNAAHELHKLASGGSITTEARTCLPLSDILGREEYDVPARIQYMDIDIEGYEMEALAGLNLGRYHVDVVSIENSFHDRHYEEPMYAAGYSKVGIIGSDDMWHKPVPRSKPLRKPPNHIPETVAYKSLSKKNRLCCEQPDSCPTFNP